MSTRHITTHPLDVTPTGHRTEFLYDDGTNQDVLVCAAHGGRIEPGTAEQAIELATRLPAATCWACLGYDDESDEFERWHPPSTAIDPDGYPLLADIADRRFHRVVSLHGLADEGLLVGGGIAPEIKQLVGDRLDAVVAPETRTVSSGEYAGVHPDNFVNWLAKEGGGLQIEQGPSVRTDQGDAVVAELARLLTDNRI